MTEDVFSSDVTDPKPADPVMLDQLVGEGKKYKTVDDLARSRIEADQFIDKLKGETSEMREALAELQAKNEEYERILKAGREVDDTTPTGQVKPDDIAALVDQAVQAREAQQSTERNIRQAQDALVEKLGSIEDARAYVAKRAGELGVTVEYLQAQAATSPSAFAALMGTASKPSTPAQASAASIPASTTSTSGGIQYGTKEYFSEMRRSNPNQYFSPKVQNEMFNLVKEGKLKL